MQQNNMRQVLILTGILLYGEKMRIKLQVIKFHDNYGINAGEGNIVVGAARNGATVNNVEIFNNTLSKGLGTWSGNPAIHTNCIHIHATHSSMRFDGLKIYNNTVTGDMGTNSTSYIFSESVVELIGIRTMYSCFGGEIQEVLL